MPRLTHPIPKPKNCLFRCIGLMSGTALDGIDVAYIETDGRNRVEPGGFISTPYSAAFRKRLRGCLGQESADAAVTAELTLLHARAVKHFCQQFNLAPENIDMLGFHGHTLTHAPERGFTLQMGDGAALAQQTGIPVVYDFRSEDVKAGGQGAPLVPFYHRALAGRNLARPLVFLNIGGVANLTFIGSKGLLLAGDTGPGNALLDDWVLRHTGKAYDAGGSLAASGKVNKAWLNTFLAQPFFRQKMPKSLDRDAFAGAIPQHLSAANGAATLTAMTAASIAAAMPLLPQPPHQIFVCGGGRHNATLMRQIKKYTGCVVLPIEAAPATPKLNGDAIEAEAFAYLAARVVLGLPISTPKTTGRK